MGAQRLGDLPADAVDRVEVGERVLEDHRDLRAVDAAPRLRLGMRQEVLGRDSAPGRT